MKKSTKTKLEKAGFKIGTVSELLGLSPEDEKIIEIRLQLADLLAKQRTAKRLTQQAVSERMGSSQSRFAVAERGAEGTSVDYLIRGLLVIGVSPKEIAKAIAQAA
jgi:predicted XRE-type DNA-binding protein